MDKPLYPKDWTKPVAAETPHPEFPKWKYHASEKACIVQNAEEEEALGEGWQNAPVTSNAPEEPKQTAKNVTEAKADIPLVREPAEQGLVTDGVDDDAD